MRNTNLEPPLSPITETGRTLAPLIDHTLLKADTRHDQIIQLCREAHYYGFFAVCVLPTRVSLAVRSLAGSAVKTATVIGFPLGATTASAKAFETTEAVQAGAQELDMVMAVGALKDRDYDYVKSDIHSVVRAAGGRTVKVIIETALLTNDEKESACKLAMEAGAHFVKTSTGLAGGATEADVRLLRQLVGDRIGVKASGGIQTCRDALTMIRAGATRIGTSSGVAIVTGINSTE
ncbi:MAG: deoxyribose-phosphate aldolase [Verrucomicrobia bacterium]|nr:deoxyribose-phosphate aldolase [Verrucomicrobiota bacterium]MBU4246772.1 deoxyribose-phosphate aldolase [Verrucomicrobiota bacterium]MBU4290560.1 deoxyribose-phosphate aldolase [Verrucomicrobiota bacterium]MBU4496620.1 deoxyribose-phosphate aldolase [Verrucomicrobiota bacterium]MCG2681681.1 deoxyribose-phosphate aldolase [Kiritimatiellia bacterium]